MKLLVISALLAASSGALGLYGISGWNGESGGHWVAIFGLTFIVPVMWTRSWILGGMIHMVLCFSGVWGISRIYVWARSDDEIKHVSLMRRMRERQGLQLKDDTLCCPECGSVIADNETGCPKCGWSWNEKTGR